MTDLGSPCRAGFPPRPGKLFMRHSLAIIIRPDLPGLPLSHPCNGALRAVAIGHRHIVAFEAIEVTRRLHGKGGFAGSAPLGGKGDIKGCLVAGNPLENEGTGRMSWNTVEGKSEPVQKSCWLKFHTHKIHLFIQKNCDFVCIQRKSLYICNHKTRQTMFLNEKTYGWWRSSRQGKS